MVHALREACRVLKTGGYLLDLRPALVHRRVGLVEADSYQQVGVMREHFRDDHAANRALTEVINAGLLRLNQRSRFECTRTMDHLSEFKARLDELVSLGKGPAHDWLFLKVRQQLQSIAASQKNRSRARRARIVMRGPIDLRVLTKT